MKTRKRLREMVTYAEGLGIEDVSVQHGGKHPQLKGLLPDGRLLRYVLAGSPSDRRGAKNAEAHLRRLVRPHSQPATRPAC